MRLVFLGTPRAAVPSLRELLRAGHQVALVVTRPDKPAGRSSKPIAPPVKREAVENGLEVFQPTKVRNQGFLERIRQAEPEVLVVVAYGRILTRRVLEVAALGSVNLHFSLLPAYRGAAPVQWAIARGETETGVSTMMINEGLDEGDVLLRRVVAIEPDERAPELESRLADLGAALLGETLTGLASGAIRATPQDPSLATFAPVLSRADGEIGPDRTAREIACRVRGFDPWPGVWMRKGETRIRLRDVRVLGEGGATGAVGEITGVTDDGLVLICGQGSRLLVRKLQPEGRRALSARDAVNGRHLAPGDRLEARPPER